MSYVTDSMFKTVIIGVIFLSLMGFFNILFIGGQLGNTSNMTLEQILGQSWAIFTQPELIIINSVLGLVGLAISLIIARELLPI